MYAYLGILFVLCINSFLVITKEYKKIGPYLLFISFLILTFFAGFRKDLGLDFFRYEDIFNRVASLKEIFQGNSNYQNLHGEYGYLFLNSIIKSMDLSFQWVIFIMAFASMAVLVCSFKRYTPYYLLALTTYVTRFYFIRDMGQIRQGLACALVFFSVRYIFERQFKKFVFVIILASLFHTVALAALPLYFITKIKIKDKTKVFIVIVAILVGSFNWLRSLINSLSFIIPNEVVYYANQQSYGYELGILNPVALFQTAFLVFFIIYKKKIKEKLPYYDIVLNMYWISTVLLFLLNEVAILAGRISTVFATVEPIIITSVIFVFRNKLLAFFIIILYIMVMFYVNFVLRFSDLYIPYRNIITH